MITIIMVNMSAKNELHRQMSVRPEISGEFSSSRHGSKWVCIDEIVEIGTV